MDPAVLTMQWLKNHSFRLAKENLKIKARRAAFKLRSILDPGTTDPRLAISLLNTMVRPIAVYGSEVWGADFTTKSPKKFYDSLFNLSGDSVSLSYARRTLGIHKKSVVAATYGELGLHPFSLSAIKAAIKYTDHLNSSDHNSLLAQCWQQIKIAKSQDTWFVKMGNICDSITSSMHKSSHEICKDLFSFFNQSWQNCIKQPNGKLRTYSALKEHFQFEQYMCDVKNLLHRQALCKLRISCHNVSIEMGRYTIPVTPLSLVWGIRR